MRDAHIKKKKKKRKKKSQIPPHQLYPITRTPRLIWSLYYQKTKLTNSRLEFISASPSPHQRCPLTLFSLFFFHPFGDDHQTPSLPPPSPPRELSFQTPTSPWYFQSPHCTLPFCFPHPMMAKSANSTWNRPI